MPLYDEDHPDLIRYGMVRARKEHTCILCGKSIPKGSSYYTCVWKCHDTGKIQQDRMHDPDGSCTEL